MIYVFHGKDDFSAHEALEELRGELDTDGMLADNTVTIEGGQAKPEELLVLCQTLPFLSTHRLIIVRGLLKRFESEGGRGRRARKAADLGAWQAFIDGLPLLPEATALVFIDDELQASNAMVKALQPAPKVRLFPLQKQGEVASWIIERARKYGLSLEPRAVAAMAQLVGSLWILDSELRKLAVYANGKQVSEDDVRALVSLAREPNVFTFVDATVEGRARDAADMLQRLIADGDSAQRLLAVLARQYRLLLLTKELQARRVSPQQIATQLQVPNFLGQRLLRQAPAFDERRLRIAYHKLLDADLSVKRGIFDDETALELLVFELAPLASPQGGRPGYSRPPGGPPRPRPAQVR